MSKIKFKKLHDKFQIPKRATDLAAGFDVTVTKIEHIDSDMVYCYLGFAAQLEEGYKLELVPRSNLTKYRWIMNNSPGQGDADYEHEYQMRFIAIPNGITQTNYNGKTNFKLTYEDFPYKVGDRIGQVFLSKVEETEWEEVDSFEDRNTNRVGGFGSTGL